MATVVAHPFCWRVSHMARTAVYDTIVVESIVTPEKVRELVLRRSESAKLDFKEMFAPSDRRSVLRLVKHVLAMFNTLGGYLVIGVDDDGTPRGLTDSQLSSIDEANIRGTIAAFSDVPIPVFVQTGVPFDGLQLAIVAVLPMEGRLAVATKDGTVSGAADKPLFRGGDVLVRHGSRSERWNQDDADWLSERTVKARREQWLREFVGDFRQLQILVNRGSSVVPISASVFDQTSDDFRGVVLDLLRSNNG